MIYNRRIMRGDFQKIWSVIIFLCASHWTFTQEVEVRVSYDTLYVGNVLAVQFHMEDWQGEIENPDFGDFPFVGGPQISSSTRISQGMRSSEKSILYYVKSPESPGTYVLPSQRLIGEGEEIYSKEVVIEVLSNPENIQQNPVISREDPRSRRSLFPERDRPPVRGERKRF